MRTSRETVAPSANQPAVYGGSCISFPGTMPQISSTNLPFPTPFLPWTLFNTPDEAAVDFTKKAVPLTLADDKERGAFIYEISIFGQGKKYFYPYIFTGMHDNVILGFIDGYLGLPRVNFIGMSLRPMSFAHTHPRCDCHRGDVFSSADEFLTKLPGIKFVYLGTPNGTTMRIDKINLNPVTVAK